MEITNAWQLVIAACTGIGLSAACGFRVFIPVLFAAAAARAGLLTLSESMSWLSSDIALIILGIATILEITAYFVPWLDNALDVISAPAAVIAAGVLTAGLTSEISPVLRWPLVAVAAANTGIIKGAMGGVRATSTASTGGMTNFVVSGSEFVGAAAASALSIFIPVFAAVIAAVLAVICIILFRKMKNIVYSLADRFLLKVRGGAPACAGTEVPPPGDS